MQPQQKAADDVGQLAPRLTQHIRYGLTPLPFGTLLPSVATSQTRESLDAMLTIKIYEKKEI